MQRRNGGEEEKVESRDPDLAGGAKNKLKRLPVAWWAMALQCCCTAAYRKSPRTPSRELVWKFVSQSEGLWRPACQSDERILPEEFSKHARLIGRDKKLYSFRPLPMCSPSAAKYKMESCSSLVRASNWCKNSNTSSDLNCFQQPLSAHLQLVETSDAMRASAWKKKCPQHQHSKFFCWYAQGGKQRRSYQTEMPEKVLSHSLVLVFVFC